MVIEFHRQVASDISRIMNYYEDVAGQKLADEFYAELRYFFQRPPILPTHIMFEDMISDV
jgi:hypothetical protein